MTTIFLLTDYLGRFGSKHNSDIYKNGMNKKKLTEIFESYGYKVEFLPFYKINFKERNWENKIVLYTSQEDVGLYYKDYIEDLIYGLELQGALTIPPYKYLKAHSNKVFMEILRDLSAENKIKNLTANHYGTLEELMLDENELTYPVVIKSAEGSMSTNVSLANNKAELYENVKKLAATRHIKEEARELIRSVKYSNYQKQSRFRKKFITQSFIPGLANDWKVLVFGDKFYLVERRVKKGDFRASGAGLNTFGSNASAPSQIFHFARMIKDELNLPMVSLDIAQANNEFYLIEFQALYFGTSGQWKSDTYFKFVGEQIVEVKNDVDLEDVYADSIVSFLSK